jgi:hypothetical protein
MYWGALQHAVAPERRAKDAAQRFYLRCAKFIDYPAEAGFFADRDGGDYRLTPPILMVEVFSACQ